MERTDGMARTGRLSAAFRIAILTALLAPARSGSAQDATAARIPPTPEAWDSVYIGGVKVGHIHTKVESLSDKGRPLVRVRYDADLSFKRDKDQVNIVQQYGTIEKPDGAVLKLET